MRKAYQAVSQILGDIMGLAPDTVSPETDLSSLRYQELAAAAIACEKTFHIEMEDERVRDLRTVSDWVSYILQRLGERDDAYTAPDDQDRESWYYQ